MVQTSLRIVSCEIGEISYLLERKPVKNLNLRIHKDCRVFVSADASLPPEDVDAFVLRKAAYIHSVQRRFAHAAQYAPQPKQYISGETFYILGHGLRLKVEQASRDSVSSDGVFLSLRIQDPTDPQKRKRLVNQYLNQQCLEILHAVMMEIYPTFQKYGVALPALRIRSMDTRWGSCTVGKQSITLNRRLLEVPRDCIEYVVTHEFCHFIHPNHSKQFYTFLNMLMPDWNARKQVLDRYAAFSPPPSKSPRRKD